VPVPYPAQTGGALNPYAEPPRPGIHWALVLVGVPIGFVAWVIGSFLVLMVTGTMGASSGGNAVALAARCSRRGIEANVRMLGWIDFKWLPVLYRQALAYVLPSREETFGRTTTEALASATPCLLQDIPIMHEIAGEAAVIVDFNNRELVTRTLRRLYEDESLRQRLGVAGLERSKKFSFEKMAVERVGAVLHWLETRPK
jgi:glycosyltransferase involved in cell wall biosynthesis